MGKVVGRNSRTFRTAPATMVNTRMIRKMGMASLLGRVGMSTRAAAKMMSEMGMERCTGLMAQCTRESGREASNTDKERSYSQMAASKKEDLRIMYSLKPPRLQKHLFKPFLPFLQQQRNYPKLMINQI